MPRNVIPERDPVGELFAGSLLRYEGSTLLSVGPLPGCESLFEGDIILRYGIRYLGRPHVSVVPGLLALDYGDMLTGAEALDFLLTRSNLHPRADVIGYRNDGQDEMITVKSLDFALPLEVLAYVDAQATRALASVSALIAPETITRPPYLERHLPRYESIAEWQHHEG